MHEGLRCTFFTTKNVRILVAPAKMVVLKIGRRSRSLNRLLAIGRSSHKYGIHPP